jgi:hypothetical protein
MLIWRSETGTVICSRIDSLPLQSHVIFRFKAYRVPRGGS